MIIHNEHEDKKYVQEYTQASSLLTYHPGQCDQSALNLRVVDVLKQVVRLKDVMRLQTVILNGSDKIANVFQLQKRGAFVLKNKTNHCIQL